jgi:putative transposase
MTQYKTLNHCKYLCQYHIIWCSKFRFNVIKDDIEIELKNILYEISKKYDYQILEIETMSEHIHLFIGVKPTVAPTDIVRTLKSLSTIELFKKFPKLKKFYSNCGSLWSKGYFVSTIGNVSEETIRKYIKEQKNDSK